MLSDCAAGLVPPCPPLNERLDGDADSEGDAVTVSVTLTTWGEPCAPAAVIVTWPVKVPGPRPAGEAVTCTVPGAAPDVGDSVNQAASSLAV